MWRQAYSNISLIIKVPMAPTLKAHPQERLTRVGVLSWPAWMSYLYPISWPGLDTIIVHWMSTTVACLSSIKTSLKTQFRSLYSLPPKLQIYSHNSTRVAISFQTRSKRINITCTKLYPNLCRSPCTSYWVDFTLDCHSIWKKINLECYKVGFANRLMWN